VYHLARSRNIFLQRTLYKLAKKRPKAARRLLLGQVRKQLGADVDMRHFTPRYNPWDERLCAVPDGDLFRTLRQGKASIVTDEIARFTATGLQLKSGASLEADIIITATGLNVQLLGGMALTVDGAPVSMQERLSYKAVMAEGVPNFGFILGYTNASWTLKADIAADYLCRVINHLQESGKQVAIARDSEGCTTPDSVMSDLKSGYVERANAVLPRQGTRLPWRILNQYETDKVMLTKDPIEDGVLQFS
jgi:cation diffusion facilitator CzcD-associated flavoprotein CzcO